MFFRDRWWPWLVLIFSLAGLVFPVKTWADSAAYNYVGNIGTVTQISGSTVNGTATGGTLVNPSLVSYSNGTTGSIYVYNNAQFDSSHPKYRLISVFTQDGTTNNYNFTTNITLDTSSFPTEPDGLTIDNNGNIYLTTPNGNFVAKYSAPLGSYVAGTVITPTLMNADPQNYGNKIIGVPSIHQLDNSILVGGQFYNNSGHSPMYTMLHLYADGSLSFILPSQDGSNNYYVNNVVAAPDGTYLATGSFSIDGQNYNLAKIDPDASPVATGILPPNVSGIDDAGQASIYNVSSLNSDDQNNIYVSGQFGIVTSGQYQASSLLKLDSAGNYLTNIAPQGTASNQVGALSGTNLVTINTHNQNVYVLDTANSALKVFALANPPAGNPNAWLPVVLFSTAIDAQTATLSYATNKAFTSIIGAGPNANYEAGLPPDTFVNLTPSNNSFAATVQVTDTDGTKINVSFNFDKTTGNSVVTSATPLGSYDTSNGVGSSDGNGGLTSTATVTCDDGGGLVYNSVVQASMDASGALTLVFTTDFSSTGHSQTLTITWTPDPNVAVSADITVQFPNILPGIEYAATTVVSNGVTSSNKLARTWQAPAALAIAVDKPTLSLAMTPGLNNGYDDDYLTVTTTTDSASGYILNVSAAEPRLSCTVGGNTHYIAPTPQAAAELPVSTWGYNLGTTPATPATLPATPSAWLGMSATDTAFDNYDEATGSEGRNSYLYFASKIDISNPACTYTTPVMITAIAN